MDITTSTILSQFPDPRVLSDSALEEIASKMRPYPTIPADPVGTTKAHNIAFTEDAAVSLPPHHCAFALGEETTKRAY